MIEVILNESNKQTDLSRKVIAAVEIDEQLDTSLDSGTLNYITTEENNKGLNEALAAYSINANGKSFNFVGMDSRALLRNRFTAVVTQESKIRSISMLNSPVVNHRHSAQGTIKVYGTEVKILNVSGSVNGTNPTAQYANGEIHWSVAWTAMRIPSDKYNVTIEYEVNSIYSHQVSLTEPSKLLQGVLIDGLGVTRPATISYDRYTKTVSQNVEVQSCAVAEDFMHRAEGVIFVDETVDEITEVMGSIFGTNPIAYYDAAQGAIIWSTVWINKFVGYNHPYTVAITYKYTLPNAATLKDVVNRLLNVTPFDGQIFTLTQDDSVLQALSSVIAPEFKWNTQTTLWECLLQVGAVIDAMPMLIADEEGDYTVVTFEFVNAAENEVTSIGDGATNAMGENIDESQYNSALSSIVENLRENE